jgi:hypothetical protein
MVVLVLPRDAAMRTPIYYSRCVIAHEGNCFF